MSSATNTTNTNSTNSFFNATGAAINEQLPYGRIVVIKRSGQDSASFDLLDASYLFGRSESCDIRIQIPTVSEEHCRVYWSEGAKVQCLSAAGVTVRREDGEVVKVRVGESVQLSGMDVITIVERSFRYEKVPNMRSAITAINAITTINAVSSINGTPSKKPIGSIFDVQLLQDNAIPNNSVHDNAPSMIIPPAHLLSPQQPHHPQQQPQGIASPLKQGAVRTPVKNVAMSFVTSPLGMPAVREPIPASPLKQPAQRPAFTESTISPKKTPQKTPKKAAGFTEVDLETLQKKETPQKMQTPKKETPDKVKVETPLISKQEEMERNEKSCTPVAQTKELERITPRMTPRPLDLDITALKSPALQVDHEVTTSPRLSPRVTLLDSNSTSNILTSPTQHKGGLSPEQRELLMSPEINKIISASKPLNVLSPSAVALDARQVADVESPTKRGPLSVQELLLASESSALKPVHYGENEKETGEEEEFSLPITQELEQLHQRNNGKAVEECCYKVELVDQQIQAQIAITEEIIEREDNEFIAHVNEMTEEATTITTTNEMVNNDSMITVDSGIVEANAFEKSATSTEGTASAAIVTEDATFTQVFETNSTQSTSMITEKSNVTESIIAEAPEATVAEENKGESMLSEVTETTVDESLMTEDTVIDESVANEAAVVVESVVTEVPAVESMMTETTFTVESDATEALVAVESEASVTELMNTETLEAKTLTVDGTVMEVTITSEPSEAIRTTETQEVIVTETSKTTEKEIPEEDTVTTTEPMQVDNTPVIEDVTEFEKATEVSVESMQVDTAEQQPEVIMEQQMEVELSITLGKTAGSNGTEPIIQTQEETISEAQEEAIMEIDKETSEHAQETSEQATTSITEQEGIQETAEAVSEETVQLELTNQLTEDENKPSTPRRSSRVRKSITPLSPSRPMTPRSAKRTRLSVVTSAATEPETTVGTSVEQVTIEEAVSKVVTETIVTEETKEEPIKEEAIKEEVLSEEQTKGLEEEKEEREEKEEETIAVRRSTRARTPRTQTTASGRKSASTTKKRAASVLKEQEADDDNSPLLRRRPALSSQDSKPSQEQQQQQVKEDDDEKENSRKKLALEKTVETSEEGVSTPQRALRRSTRVSSAKK